MTHMEQAIASIVFDVRAAEVTQDMVDTLHAAQDLSMFADKLRAKAQEIQEHD